MRRQKYDFVINYTTCERKIFRLLWKKDVYLQIIEKRIKQHNKQSFQKSI